MNDDGSFDEWQARVAERSADPKVQALAAVFTEEADEYDPDELTDAAAARPDLASRPVLTLAAEASAALAAEGPVDELGSERAERLRAPGRRLGELGYRVGYSILAEAAAPVNDLDTEALETVVSELDWPEIMPVLTTDIGLKYIEQELGALGEESDGPAENALFMAWDQGVAYAFAEQLLHLQED